MDDPQIPSQNAHINNNLNLNQEKNTITQSNLEQIPYPKQIDREQKVNQIPHIINQLKELCKYE